MAYYVQPVTNRPQGAACPQGWEIVYDANGNPVYVRERR